MHFFKNSAVYLAVSMVILVAALFIPFPFTANSALAKAWVDVTHLPLFVAMAAALYAFLRRGLEVPTRAAWVATLLVGVALAGGSELLQGLLGRESSLTDAVNNLFGLGAALALIIAWERRSGAGLFAFFGIVACGVGVALIPAVHAAKAIERQRELLPLIGDFEADWELLLWLAQGDLGGEDTTARRDRGWATHGVSSLRIDAHGASWAGVVLLADPSDWARYRRLRFDAKNDAEPWTLGVRIDIRDGRRFRGAVDLKSGANDCSVPFLALKDSTGQSLGEAASDIVRLVLHAGEAGHRGTFFLDNVRLE